MRELHLICVGKNTDREYATLEHDYLKRMLQPKLQIHEVKAHSEDLEKEAKEVLFKINEIEKDGKAFVVLLAENGKLFDSPKFANWFEKISEQTSKLILVIGGAAGHGNDIIIRAQDKISLSTLTFPHKMARLILIEQLYRAQTIIQKHPYHK